MYPVVRMAKEFWVNRNASLIKFGEFHVSHHVCWPWDLDMWLELNNGRTLTIYDLGRLVMAKRIGILSLLKEKRWNMPMAGASVRYRRRIAVFERFDILSKVLFGNVFISLNLTFSKKLALYFLGLVLVDV